MLLMSNSSVIYAHTHTHIQLVAHLLCRQQIWHPFAYNICLRKIFLYSK